MLLHQSLSNLCTVDLGVETVEFKLKIYIFGNIDIYEKYRNKKFKKPNFEGVLLSNYQRYRSLMKIC